MKTPKLLRAFACAFAFLCVVALPARAANFTDIWWNPAESGWGMTLTHHHDKVFGVWYLYDTDGRPLWVVMPDGAFTPDGRSFSGPVYRTTGPSYRATPFQAGQVAVRDAGRAKIDFDADDMSATVTLTIGAVTQVKRVTRQPFGSAPANYPVDRSDLWWDPNESGWGLTISHHGNSLFGVWYTYAEDGRPLWIVLPGGTFADANTFDGKLYTTTGSPFAVAFDPASVKVTEVGSARIRWSGDTGTFTASVNGMTQVKTIRRQGFGTPTNNRLPTVSLALSPGADPLVAPATITLKATARDDDGAIGKVVFYRGMERLGEKAAAPYEWPVAGLAVGWHDFSARAVDNRGDSALATARKEVKAGGSGNQAPLVQLTAPAANSPVLPGTAVTVAANASDADGRVIRVEFFATAPLTLPVKIGEATAAPWSTAWSPATAGSFALTATATDDKGLQSTSAGVAVTILAPAAMVEDATRDAARFLTQATFGIRNVAEVEALRAQGLEAWLANQFLQPAASHVQYVNDRKAAGEKPDEERAYEAIWQQWLTEPGQLRARMSFALSELFVISNIAPDLDTYAMASYMDLLNRNAFGNYRTLLGEVTLHPAMGYYLNMIGSRKADPVKGTHPNENYAREVMQLFSIGLYKLNPDGTRQLDAQGRPVNTYDEAAIKGMAAAFTGWNFAGNDTANAAIFNPAKENWLEPMIPWEMWHDTAAKTLFDGMVLPAGQTARKDLNDALDALFNHPNVGPFVGRQLIQRFVTSNPSPAYIARVAAAFANNGSGVRGDLRATLRAVLLDPEARSLAKTVEAGWGKQREPVIRFANVLRALGAKSTSGRNRIWYLDNADEGLNQSPLLAPSVFNFFSPNYRQPGPLAAAGLVAPEFQVTTETSMVGGLNFFSKLVRNGGYGSGETRLALDLAELNALAVNPSALVDRLNLLFMNGAMSEASRGTLLLAVAALPAPKTGTTAVVSDRVKAALLLTTFLPDFVIQR